MITPLLEVTNLKKYFPIYGGVLYRKMGEVHALDGVSFAINQGETLGVVGESGCGKSTLGKTLLRLFEPDGGRAMFEGTNIFGLLRHELLEMRRNIQMIFQDPYSSLNPRMTVGELIREPLDVFHIGSREQREREVAKIIDMVGMRQNVLNRYPHEFSGGQRQRIGIARSVILKPKLIVADEPVSALDVSIQAQIINLMTDLQREMGLTFLFIAHDLAVVKYVSDRIAVMYLGRIVEMASREQLFAAPCHPYTVSLLSAIPVPDPRQRTQRIILKGDVPSPLNPPQGCHFHTRCFRASERCRLESPSLAQAKAGSDGHVVACFYPVNEAPQGVCVGTIPLQSS